MPPHTSHKKGVDVDIRPLRNHGRRVGVSISDDAYSRERSQRDAEPLEPRGPFTLEPGSSTTVRFEGIDLKAMQDELYPNGRWPWRYTVEVHLSPAGAPDARLAAGRGELPILPGD